MTPSNHPLDIGIVGSGIAGLSSAWLLNQNHNITIYELESRPGGHSNTVDVNIGNTQTPVDTGFIVYNHVTYPNLVALFEYLQVPTQSSDMSFAVSVDNGAFEYGSSSLNAMVGQRSNILKPRYWHMVMEIKRFFKKAEDFVTRPDGDPALRFGDFLSEHDFSGDVVDRFILPLGAAIWSTRPSEINEQPAATFLGFLASHGLLQFSGQFPWRTVIGGSREYLRRLTHSYSDRLSTNRGVTQVKRLSSGVQITDNHGVIAKHDAVVIATHADEALAMLADADDLERRVLQAFRYTKNRVVLHSDMSLMPRQKRVWSSWNFMGEVDDGVSVTYWMNKLQSLDNQNPLFVTVNPSREPSADKVHRSFDYQHPFFDFDCWTAQKELWGLQGNRNTWFCGSYFGAGFHEDALQSGLAVAEDLGGIMRPWKIKNDSDRIYRNSLNKANAHD